MKTHFLAAVLCGLALPALAQGSFGGGSFGGSFDDPAPSGGSDPGGGSFGGSFGGSETGGGTAAVGGDSFGGSFGGAGEAPTATAPPAQGAPAVGGSDFGGTFGDGGAAVAPGVVAPTPVSPPPVTPPEAPQTQGIAIDPQIAAYEVRDYGVAPTGTLRQTQFHAATPTSVPGAETVSTEAVATAVTSGLEMVVIDVLGGEYSLPGAYVAPGLAQGGSLSDRTQQQAQTWLDQITGGQRDMPIVIYCSDPMCWLSYNGTLRVVAAGYTNVYWYRGGLQAWEMAGLRVEPASF